MLKFGRNRPPPHLRTGHKMAARYFDAANMPPVPDAFDFSPLNATPLADVLANDVLGCCTSSGAGSTSAKSPMSWPTSRSPGSCQAGAGRWPP